MRITHTYLHCIVRAKGEGGEGVTSWARNNTSSDDKHGTLPSFVLYIKSRFIATHAACFSVQLPFKALALKRRIGRVPKAVRRFIRLRTRIRGCHRKQAGTVCRSNRRCRSLYAFAGRHKLSAGGDCFPLVASALPRVNPSRLTTASRTVFQSLPRTREM